MNRFYIILTIFSIVWMGCSESSNKKQAESKGEKVNLFQVPSNIGAYESGVYRNLFVESGKHPDSVKAKMEDVFQQLFYGDKDTERVYYQISDSMAYILDTYNNDVRSEGMSYGMMICVQMNRKYEFDCLWNYAKTYTQNHSGPNKGYFGWSCNPKTHTVNDPNSAPDGEEYFVMALFFAKHRWGNGTGIYNYEKEANQILHDMLHKEEEIGENEAGITNLFNLEEKKVVFVPEKPHSLYSDPSYHLPSFYELWAKWAQADNQFWKDAADTSRLYFQKAMHPKTGFVTEYMTFDGKPKETKFNTRSHHFSSDSWRVAMNIAMDCNWWGNQGWHTEKLDTYLEFISTLGDNYKSQYTQDGTPLKENWEGPGFYAMNAVAPLGASTQKSWQFIGKFWNLQVPTGTYRYYDGLLYLLAYLNVAGEYKIWKPEDVTSNPAPIVPDSVEVYDPFPPAMDKSPEVIALESKVYIRKTGRVITIINSSGEIMKMVKITDPSGTVVKSVENEKRKETHYDLDAFTESEYTVEVQLETGAISEKITF